MVRVLMAYVIFEQTLICVSYDQHTKFLNNITI